MTLRMIKKEKQVIQAETPFLFKYGFNAALYRAMLQTIFFFICTSYSKSHTDSHTTNRVQFSTSLQMNPFTVSPLEVLKSGVVPGA